MSIIGLATAIVMLLAVLAYIAIPFFTQEDTSDDTFRNKQRERALAYYERVLRNVRDLDDDLATGKIIQAEYEIERERWMERGVELLRMIEQLDDEQNISNDLEAKANDADIDAAIEHVMSSGIHEQPTANGVS